MNYGLPLFYDDDDEGIEPAAAGCIVGLMIMAVILVSIVVCVVTLALKLT